MTTRRLFHVLPHLIAGVLLAVVGGGLLLDPELPMVWSYGARAALALGFLLLLGGGLDPRRRFGRLTCGFSIAIIALVLTIAGVEALGRACQFDYRHQQAAQQRLPPFFRSPTEPIPPVFFRRAGPETWTGPVIKSGLQQTGQSIATYENEPSITVRYDELGFRNEEPLTEWEIAVAGDSFVELGFLPFDQLFTTRLGALSGKRVRNLGVSHTGPLTQLRYLELYGMSPATREVVIVFYEGNDLYDLEFETSTLQKYEATGRRDLRTIRPQSSFLRACLEFGQKPRPAQDARINAHLIPAESAAGKDPLPLTLGVRLDPTLALTAPAATALRAFVARLASFARGQGVHPWIVYMPCKTRVLEGRFRWDSPASELTAGALPRDLPERVRSFCTEEKVEFLDLTAGLRSATLGQGRLLFNALTDSHLNAEGAQAVASLLATNLVASPPPPPPPL